MTLPLKKCRAKEIEKEHNCFFLEHSSRNQTNLAQHYTVGTCTVVREKFAVKIFSQMNQTVKIKHAKIIFPLNNYLQAEMNCEIFFTQTFISQNFLACGNFSKYGTCNFAIYHFSTFLCTCMEVLCQCPMVHKHISCPHHFTRHNFYTLGTIFTHYCTLHV